MTYRVKSITQAWHACPSQWEGRVEDGTPEGGDLHIRYRWGTLTVNINGATCFSASYGDAMDGVMSLQAVKTLVGDLLDFGDTQYYEKEYT